MYSLLGTSRQLNVAPEAALSLLVGQAVSEHRRTGLYTPEEADTVGMAVSTAITLQVTISQSWVPKHPFDNLGF